MKIEEYVPAMIPMIRGKAKSLIEGTPRIYTIVIVIRVVSEVFIERPIDCHILAFTISLNVAFFISLAFSLTRSKITMVALIE